MKTRSEATIIVEMLVAEMERRYHLALEAFEIPLGMEKVDKAEYERRQKVMSRQGLPPERGMG